MGAEFELITRSAAGDLAAESLGLPIGSLALNLLSELLRSLTWALSGPREPVHIVRLLNAAIPIASGLLEQADERLIRDRLHDSLDSLSDAGDLVELSGGRWLPAPLRLVHLGTGDSHLVVGGMPTRLLGVSESSAIDFHGPFRRFRGSMQFEGEPVPIESVESWTRRPEGTLEDWAKDVTAYPLDPYTESGDGTPLQIYSPEQSRRGAPQFKRWRDSPRGCSGRHLARRTRVFGAQEYRLVEVSAEHVQRAGAALAPGEARRLMYAMDARAANPVIVNCRLGGRTTRFIFNSELPWSEQRLFAALGFLEKNPERLYERCWTFSSHVDLVRSSLADLQVVVRELES